MSIRRIGIFYARRPRDGIEQGDIPGEGYDRCVAIPFFGHEPKGKCTVFSGECARMTGEPGIRAKSAAQRRGRPSTSSIKNVYPKDRHFFMREDPGTESKRTSVLIFAINVFFYPEISRIYGSLAIK
jgi:hypothetical protein